MTTYALGNPESSSFLDANQQELALRYVEECWPNQKLTTQQLEAWTDILGRLRQGELKPALAATATGGFRPDPYKVLEAAMAARPSARVPDFKKPEPVEPTPPETAAQWFATYREILGRPQPTPKDAA